MLDGRRGLLRRGGVVAVSASAVAMAVTGIAGASVGTDSYYYSAGDTVQISGDSMLAGENVTDDVYLPDGTLGQENIVVADSNGNFYDSYTLSTNAEFGVYDVVATGQTSGSVYTTTFDPSTDTSLTVPTTLTYGAGLTLSGAVTHMGNNNAVPDADVIIAEDANSPHDCSTHTSEVTHDGPGKPIPDAGYVTLADVTTASDGSFTSGHLDPELATWAPAADAGHYFLTYQPSVGTYGFRATHKGDRGGTEGIGNISSSGCETTTVQAAPTTTSGSVSPSSVALTGSATVSYEVSSAYGVSGNTMYGATSIVQDSGPTGHLGCTPSSQSIYHAQNDAEGTGGAKDGFDHVVDGSTNATQQFTCTPTAVGTYTFHVHFADNSTTDATHPDGDYGNSDSSTLTLEVTGSGAVVPVDQVTDSSLCTFDEDTTNDTSAPTQDFRLIFTPDQNSQTTYKLNASNPGQFYYNVLYHGTGGQVTLQIPAPFVTQGAVPVHMYDGVSAATVNGQTCYTPADLVGSSSTGISSNLGPGSKMLTITVPTTANEVDTWITVHLDYGLKNALSGCTASSTLAATCTTQIGNWATSGNPLASPTPYTFTSSAPNDTGTSVQSENVFKRDPGIGGLVLNGLGAGQANTTVQITDGTGKLLGTAYTDQDGWYMWNYKYTGRATTFYIKLPAYGRSTSATLKANGILVVSFSV